MRYVESLNRAMHRLMRDDERVHFIGEDVLDPYGGAFKVAKGLSTDFPDRVVTTPISEAAIVGLGTGMALRGLRPVVEIMFGDFVTLSTDQIVNHATKFRWMYNDQVRVPLVIRTPMGGGRGYGATHSQSLESLFMGVPHLSIVAPSILHDPGTLLEAVVTRHEDPTLFVENKLLYPKRLRETTSESGEQFDRDQASESCAWCPTVGLQLYGDEPPEIAIVGYGRMVDAALEAAHEAFMQREILCRVIAPSLVKPVPIRDIGELAAGCRGLIVVEEGCITGGIGAEIACRVHENGVLRAGSHVVRVGGEDLPLPSAKQLEESILPSRADILSNIYALAKRARRSAHA